MKTGIKIGDKVTATRDIWEEASGDNPLLLYAKKGDVLVIRQVDACYPFCVSHENRSGSFGVDHDEITLVPTKPLEQFAG